MNHDLRDSTTQDLLLWLLRRRRRFRVTGYSMLPLLQPGDEVLVNPRAYHTVSPSPNDLVVAQHPHNPNLRLIKRVTAVLGDGACFVTGDNPKVSTDSRTFGAIAPQQILGKVICRFP